MKNTRVQCMQFLFHKLVLCWECYHKIQDSFQLLFIFNLGLSSPKDDCYKLPNHSRAGWAWPPSGEGELFFHLGAGHTQLGWF